ncbi:hypothetical protein ABWL39_11370 [Chitinivorax sp. PXF-14]|uniref:hypothetical protein n=1 Tax=Chitinivorax sp. PXF-14 TaxID=3230488 RepID=UPI0034656266
MSTTLSRRTFLKAGIFGGLALVTAGGIYRLTHAADTPRHFTLDADARAILAAVAPVILAGAIKHGEPDVEAAVERTHKTILALPLATQKEIQDLFALLALTATRRFLAGLSADWADAPPAEIAAFLQRWRVHSLGTLQTIYHALHDLVIGGWYGDESTWDAIGYPGPLKALS